MTYGQLISAVYGGISAQLLMLSDETLGRLSKWVLDEMTGDDCGVDLPLSLRPIADKIAGLFSKSYEGRGGAIPPPWMLLHGRCQLVLPVCMALDDGDAGRITRFLTEAAASGNPALPAGGDGPQQTALRAHLGKVRSWLSSDIPQENLDLMQQIVPAADALAGELGLDALQAVELSSWMAAERIAGVDMTATEDERELLEVALLLADGEEHEEDEIRDLVWDLQERRRERQETAGGPAYQLEMEAAGRKEVYAGKESEPLGAAETAVVDLGLPNENAVI